MISNQYSFHNMKENIRHSYDGFHSERHQTTNSMDIGTYPVENKYTGIQYHIKYPVQALLSHFRDIFNSRGFKVTEVFPGKLLLVKLGLFDRIKYIFTSMHPKQYLLEISTNQFKSVRRLNIQRISSESSEPIEGQDDIRQFFNWIDQQPLNITHSMLNNEDENQNDIDFSEYQQDMYSLQATSTYMYHKIFIDRNYSIGKKMNKLIQEGPKNKSSKQIQENNKQIHEVSSTESKMIIGALNQITDDMLQNFNCTRKQLLQILCHCRKTVQDYYHNKMFLYKTKDQLQFQSSQINDLLQNNPKILAKVPQTIKKFKKIADIHNSTEILKQLFLSHYIFEFQCRFSAVTDIDKKQIGEQLGKIFREVLEEKIKILQLWGYSHQCWDQYISIFIHQ